ncbi:hypothetical protein O6V14_04700 [Sphingomonas faeni]
MNAMLKIVPTDDAPAEPWKRYLPAIDALRPMARLRERSLRAGLMLQRDLAGVARRATVSVEAEQAFYVIEQIAGEHCLSDMPEPNLFALGQALAKMREAALEIAAATQRDG